MDILTYQIIIVLFFLLSGLFSGTETAIVSVNRLSLEVLAQKGNKRAARSITILDRVEDALGMVLIGNNIVNIAATAFITYLATQYYLMGEEELFFITAVQTVAFLVFCEVLPKIIARSKGESFLLLFSMPIKILMFLMVPLIKVSLLFAGKFKDVMKIELNDGASSIVRSRDEINILFKLGKKTGAIKDSSEEFVSEILTFRDICVSEVMTPTIDIVSVRKNTSVKQLVEIVTRTRFSRIPVFDGRVDNIIGYVFYRDILKNKKVSRAEDLLTSPHYVPASRNIFELYLEMYDNNIPIVFVVNERGAVIGMVSNEDIAEEMVGEIHTRDHSKEALIVEEKPGCSLVNGVLDIEYFQKYFNVTIQKKRFETLTGFLSFKLKKIPGIGDRFEYQGLVMTVVDATERAVLKVRVKKN